MPGFPGDILGFSTSSKRGVLVHKNSLASCPRCHHNIEPRALTCPFKQSVLGHCQVDTSHINAFERDSVSSKFCVCSPPSRSRLPRLGLCQWKRLSQKLFWLKSAPSARERSCIRTCMHIWQSPYETVADSSDEGDSSHWIFQFCERYWFAGFGGQGSGRRASCGQDSTCEIGVRTERAVSSVSIIRLWC